MTNALMTIIAALNSLFSADHQVETVEVDFENQETGELEPRDIGEDVLRDGFKFTNNLRLAANFMKKNVEDLGSSFGVTMPWILSEGSPLTQNIRSVIICSAQWNGKIKAFKPVLNRISWVADDRGLPVDCRSISITPIDNPLINQPSVFIGHLAKPKGKTVSKKNITAMEQKCFEFFFSGGRLTNLPSEQMAMAEVLTASGSKESSSMFHDSEIVWVDNLIFGVENVQAHLDVFCAPPTREAKLEADKRKLQAELAQRDARATAQDAKIAELERKFAMLMGQIS